MTVKDKKDIDRLYWEERYSFGAIGKLYGVSKQRIERIVKDVKSFEFSATSFASGDMIAGATCGKCLIEPGLITHYIDGNIDNGKPGNMIDLCRRCEALVKSLKK